MGSGCLVIFGCKGVVSSSFVVGTLVLVVVVGTPTLVQAVATGLLVVGLPAHATGNPNFPETPLQC